MMRRPEGPSGMQERSGLGARKGGCALGGGKGEMTKGHGRGEESWRFLPDGLYFTVELNSCFLCVPFCF